MIQLVLLSLLALTAGATEPTCDELGFTGEQVCSDCDVLGQYLKDEELVADCKKCCKKDQVSVKYTKAELIIDQWRANASPQIKDFIDKRSKAYSPQLKVQYTQGAAPRLRLSGPAGSESVRIDNWKSANIAEFLDERLDRSGSSGGAGTARTASV